MATINLLLFLLAGISLGAYLVNLIDPLSKLSLLERLVAMLTVGFVVFGFVALIFSLLTKDILTGSLFAIILALAASYRLLKKHRWKFGRLSSFRFSWSSLVIILLLLALLGVVFQVLVILPSGFPAATLIGWGDVAYHLDMISHLAFARPFVLDQPIANGFPLTYPFFINFLSAMLLRLGVSLYWAWYVPAVIFSLTLFFGLYALGRRILGSPWWAAALVALVLFGGGLGFGYFFKDMAAGYHSGGLPGIVAVINSPPHQYTHLDMRTGGKPPAEDSHLNIVWVTPAISFFSHQRSFAPGASLFLIVFLGWYLYDYEVPESDRKFLWPWLLLLGFLPVVHTHSLVAAAILFGSLFVAKFCRRQNIRPWLIGIAASLLLALPQLAFLFSSRFGGENGFPVKLWWGFMTCTHSASWLRCQPGVAGTDSNALWFWLKNFGVIFAGWVVALAWWAHPKITGAAKALIPGSLLLFLIPNIIIFQPWEFDNNKILFYWWLLAVLLLLAALQKIANRPLRTILVVVVLFCGSLGGLVDTSTRVEETVQALRREAPADHSDFYGQSEVEAASWIDSHTAPNDAFLAADGANNFIPMLTGRPLYLGFEGWLWTQGHSRLISQRQSVIEEFFNTADPSPLCAQGVRWIMWEQPLLDSYPEAKNFNISSLGPPSMTQQTPGGTREIFPLGCTSPSVPKNVLQ